MVLFPDVPKSVHKIFMIRGTFEASNKFDLQCSQKDCRKVHRKHMLFPSQERLVNLWMCNFRCHRSQTNVALFVGTPTVTLGVYVPQICCLQDTCFVNALNACTMNNNLWNSAILRVLNNKMFLRVPQRLKRLKSPFVSFSLKTYQSWLNFSRVTR